MSICTAKSERVNADANGFRCGFIDRLEFPGNPEIEAAEIDFRVERLAMNRRRYGAVLDRQNSLDEPTHTGGRFHMPQICFNGTNRQRVESLLTVYRANSSGFHRVAHCSTGAMGFNIINIDRINTAALQYATHEYLLALSTGNGDAGFLSTIRIHAGGKNQGMDVVAICFCRAQWFEHENCPTLATHITCTRSVESAATAVL